MAYSLNKIRGQKHSGRGHRKHKSGSKGGTGRAGHRTHKNLAPVIYKKSNRYIKYNEIIKYKLEYVSKKWIVEIDGVETILSYRFNKKIIEIPFNSMPIRGSNCVNRRIQ